MAIPNWLTSERRSSPTPEETFNLIEHQIEEIAQHLDQTQRQTAQNSDDIHHLDRKVDDLTDNVTTHLSDTRKLVESYRVLKLLQRWLINLVAGATAVAALFVAWGEVFDLLKDRFSR